MAFQSVHSPCQVPNQYRKPYLHIKDENRQIYLGELSILPVYIGPKDTRFTNCINNFLGMVSAMDEAIGKIIKALKDTNHYSNAVIIFSSDVSLRFLWNRIILLV